MQSCCRVWTVKHSPAPPVHPAQPPTRPTKQRGGAAKADKHISGASIDLLGGCGWRRGEDVIVTCCDHVTHHVTHHVTRTHWSHTHTHTHTPTCLTQRRTGEPGSGGGCRPCIHAPHARASHRLLVGHRRLVLQPTPGPQDRRSPLRQTSICQALFLRPVSVQAGQRAVWRALPCVFLSPRCLYCGASAHTHACTR